MSRAAKVAARRAKRAFKNMTFAARLERAGAVKKPAPQWWIAARSRARELALKVKEACLWLDL